MIEAEISSCFQIHSDNCLNFHFILMVASCLINTNLKRESPMIGRSIFLLFCFNCSVALDSFVIPWTIAPQAPLSMGFPRQEYWSGLPFPSPEDLPDSGIRLVSCIGRQILITLSHQGSPRSIINLSVIPASPFSSLQRGSLTIAPFPLWWKTGRRDRWRYRGRVWGGQGRWATWGWGWREGLTRHGKRQCKWEECSEEILFLGCKSSCGCVFGSLSQLCVF